MSPEKARIFLVEDNKRYQEIVRFIVERGGLKVVCCAGSVDEVVTKVDSLRELGVNVAIIDDRLDDFGDGEKIVDVLRNGNVDVPVIGLSGSVGVKLGNRNFDKGTLVSKIDSFVRCITDL